MLMRYRTSIQGIVYHKVITYFRVQNTRGGGNKRGARKNLFTIGELEKNIVNFTFSDWICGSVANDVTSTIYYGHKR